jgi:hypothetical protein
MEGEVGAGRDVEVKGEVEVAEDTEVGLVDVVKGVVVGVGMSPPAIRVMILLGTTEGPCLLITNRGCSFQASF